MTTLTRRRSLFRLLCQTFRLLGRHFLPFFLIGGIPWALYALIPIALGQPDSLLELQFSERTFSQVVFYPFFYAFLCGLLFFPLVNGALVHATTQALQRQLVQVILAYRTALPRWGKLLGMYLLFGMAYTALSLILFGLVRWYNPDAWTSPTGPALHLAGQVRSSYYLLLGSFLTQVVVVEGGGVRAVWTRSSRLFTRAGWQWAGVMGILITLGELLSMELGRVGRWAEVLNGGLTNLLCMVGLTVFYWEMRRRGEEEGSALEGSSGLTVGNPKI